jgi:threonine/homoserine/homoserine lactone efflux protein
MDALLLDTVVTILSWLSAALVVWGAWLSASAGRSESRVRGEALPGDSSGTERGLRLPKFV